MVTPPRPHPYLDPLDSSSKGTEHNIKREPAPSWDGIAFPGQQVATLLLFVHVKCKKEVSKLATDPDTVPVIQAGVLVCDKHLKNHVYGLSLLL